MPRPRRSDCQLAAMIADPRRVLLDSAFWDAELCRRWLAHVADRTHVDLAEARHLAIIGARLALRVIRQRGNRGSRNLGLLGKAHGVLGSIFRKLGKTDKAVFHLEKAARFTRLCSHRDDRSDINRRRAVLAESIAQRSDGSFVPTGLQEALQLAETAVYDAVGGIAQARAHTVRGFIRVRIDDSLGGATDARRAIELIDALKQPYNHTSALSVLVWALSKGDAAEREEGIGYLQQLREALPQRTPAIRARLIWAEALLYAHNRRRKARARHLLDQARRTFLRLGMRPEAIGATADLARIDPAGAVPKLCTELLAFLDSGPIRELVEKLRLARLGERVDLIDQLRAAIEGPGLLPAAAWPAP